MNFLYPPRPIKAAVPRESIDNYYKFSWTAQIKFNDQHCVFDCLGTSINTLNRRGNRYTTPIKTDGIHHLISKLGLDQSKRQYFDGGCLENKSKFLRGIIVIWDILIKNSEHLVGTTYNDRYNLLLTAASDEYIVDINGVKITLGLKLSDNLILPKQYTNYSDVWDVVNKANEAAGWTGSGEPVLEGIMLVNPFSKLEYGFKEANNMWRARSRVHTNRHTF